MANKEADLLVSNGFLPTDFKQDNPPSQYLRLEEGQHVIVIMHADEVVGANAITGYEWWEEDEKGRHPHRVRSKKDAPKDARQFLAFKVWNKTLYEETEQVYFQILQVTQKSIIKAVAELATDEDWGDPTESYLICIDRSGQQLDTTYSIKPKPRKDIPKKVLDEFSKWTCDLNKLFEGEDPFESEEGLPF